MIVTTLFDRVHFTNNKKKILSEQEKGEMEIGGCRILLTLLVQPLLDKLVLLEIDTPVTTIDGECES